MKKIMLMAAFLFCAAQVCAQTTEDTGMPASLLAYDYFFPEKTSPADAGLTTQEGDAKLLKAVVLSRHGVRSPTQAPSVLDEWSSRPWPYWDESPGQLTERGAELIRAGWYALRTGFAEAGLLPATGCPDSDAVFIYADGTQRTKASAEAMLQGLAPGCGFSVTASRTPKDPILHPVESGVMPSPIFSEDARHALAGNLSSLRHRLMDEIEELDALLGPASPALCPPGKVPCGITDMATSLVFPHDGSRETVRLRGGMDIAASVAEILLLECLQWPAKAQSIPFEAQTAQPDDGMSRIGRKVLDLIDAPTFSEATISQPPASVAPVLSSSSELMVNPREALHLLRVHSDIMNALQRTPETARASGLPLLLLIAETLEGASPLSTANDAELVIFSGHDSNIANIAALLDLHWDGGQFPEDSIPPGSMLMFRLWLTPQGHVVQISFLSQTLAALLSTDEDAMSSAAFHEVSLTLPGETMETPSGRGMPLDDFALYVRGMAGEDIASRLDQLFSPKPHPQ